MLFGVWQMGLIGSVLRLDGCFLSKFNWGAAILVGSYSNGFWSISWFAASSTESSPLTEFEDSSSIWFFMKNLLLPPSMAGLVMISELEMDFRLNWQTLGVLIWLIVTLCCYSAKFLVINCKLVKFLLLPAIDCCVFPVVVSFCSQFFVIIWLAIDLFSLILLRADRGFSWIRLTTELLLSDFTFPLTWINCPWCGSIGIFPNLDWAILLC